MVSGLQARPELNGRVGTVVSYDAAKDRYNVSIASGTEQSVIALRPQNILLDELEAQVQSAVLVLDVCTPRKCTVRYFSCRVIDWNDVLVSRYSPVNAKCWSRSPNPPIQRQPPRSDAKVEIGMLMGDRDSLTLK